MIGKIILLPFRLLSGSFSLVISIIKLILSITGSVIKLLFSNSIGVIIGIVGGFFIAKKQMDSQCDCETDEEPVE